MSNDAKKPDNESGGLEGVFVETAFTVAEVEQAVYEESQLGIHDAPCAFLGKPSGE